MALSDYLKSEPLDLPLVVDTGPVALSSGEGYVLPSFERGAVLLQNQHGDSWRLSWEADDAQKSDADRRRALPVGDYSVVGYRLLRDSAAGVAWHLSATGKQLAKVRVEPGQAALVAIPDTITIQGQLRGKGVGMSITGLKGAGLSIYKGGQRIPIGYQLTGVGGRPLAKGSMNYG